MRLMFFTLSNIQSQILIKKSLTSLNFYSRIKIFATTATMAPAIGAHK